MSLVKKFLLGLGGAALMVTGVASTASAHDPIGAGDYCELYAREYAAVHAPSSREPGYVHRGLPHFVANISRKDEILLGSLQESAASDFH